jgi:hypothetical protein
MTTTGEWDRLEANWRAARTSSAVLEAMIERTRRDRRAILLVRVLSTVLALVALGIVGAALRHAANAFEAALGLVVAVGIATVWWLDAMNQGNDAEKVEAPANEYRAARRALCIRQDRFARLGWVVVALDLAFLFPWWIGGFAVHGSGFKVGQVLTIWLPLALMAAFIVWTIALRRRARAELRRIARESSHDLAMNPLEAP